MKNNKASSWIKSLALPGALVLLVCVLGVRMLSCLTFSPQPKFL